MHINIHQLRQKKIIGVSILLIFFAVNFDAAAQATSSLTPKRISSFKHLKRLLNATSWHANYPYLKLETLANGTTLVGAVPDAVNTDSGEYSETNVQVQGVDEGDIVKTDGRYIYQIQNGQVRISRAYPVDKMASVALLSFNNEFSPTELYLNGKQLIVIGSSWRYDGNRRGGVPMLRNKGKLKMAVWAPWGESRTVARVYDLTDHRQPVLQREVTFTGSYLSSRKIGANLYVIGRKYPNYYFNYFNDGAQQPSLTRDNTLPKISDSLVNNGQEHTLPIDQLYYFKNFVEPDYVVIAGLQLDALDQPASTVAYLGGGDITYASTKNLYVSAADYNASTTNETTRVSAPVTHVYKFALAEGAVTFSSAGEVPGTPLNSFSMDEHNDYFRIATTVNQWTSTTESGSLQTWNNLYTLDSSMNIAGRLEHIAEGERIYSARFIGDRSYLVTFKQTDPLFVIDLAVPEAPQILGELKIPGFSNYLHPYDDTHLLGFGQDTEATPEGGVLTKGVKLALFDVSDVANPKEMHKLTIGDSWSYSPLSWDHKALFFDKKRNLLGFPISVTAKAAEQEWPSEVFQGAHVYSVTLEDGFQLQAAITHQQATESYRWDHYIQRLLSIGDQLYTLSETRVQANAFSNFKQTGALDFPINYPQTVECGQLDASASEVCVTIVEPVPVQ
ncbi:MAG: beta-propeller domain-containing protein [Methylovulum sp.]|nr:beta-propeller domain-containing protein [Methylovulum sp.]